MTDVFISFSQADCETARRLAEVLRQNDLSVWIDDQSLSPGVDIAAHFAQAIEESKTILVLLGSKTATNSWVRSEAALALSLKDKRVVPILTAKDADIPFMLRHLYAVDLSNSSQLPVTAKELAQHLKHSPTPRISDPSARFAFVTAESDALRLEQLAYETAAARSNTLVISNAIAHFSLSVIIVLLFISFKEGSDLCNPLFVFIRGKLNLSDQLISMLLGVIAGAVPYYFYGPLKERINRTLSKRIGGEA